MAKPKHSKSKPKGSQVPANLAAPTWELNAGKKLATATFSIDPPLSLELDSAGVQGILNTLGQIRGGMVPEVAKALVPGEKYGAIPNPFWVVGPAATEGDSILHIRDPRFGWLHYLIPRAEGENFNRSSRNMPDHAVSLISNPEAELGALGVLFGCGHSPNGGAPETFEFRRITNP